MINWSKMTTMKQASCEATHVHYVTVSVGLWLEYIKGSGSKFSFIPDWWPCRRTDLWEGLTAEGWGGVLEVQPERTGKDGKMKLEEVKFRIGKREGASKRESKEEMRKSVGGATVDLEYILVVFVDLFSAVSPGFGARLWFEAVN